MIIKNIAYTIIVGTHHYSPQRSMPELKKELERLGFEVALINPDWNPEKDKRGLPGLEVLEKTDLAVFFTRWLKLEGQQYDQMMGYVKAVLKLTSQRGKKTIPSSLVYLVHGRHQAHFTSQISKKVYSLSYRVLVIARELEKSKTCMAPMNYSLR